jgi:hypothetical protein
MGRTALIAGTATAVSGHVAARQQGRYEQPAAAPAPAPPDAPPFNIVDELTKLADLKDRGILTDEEFAVQKARLLGS